MEVTLVSLWMPIVFSALAVFLASFLAWTVLPHHKPDWTGIPNEDGFLEALRANNTPPGQYMFPHCANPSDLKDPEKKRRYDAGPHGTLTVWSGPPKMGGKMTATVIFYLVVGVFVGYIGSLSLPVGAEYMTVFRVTGTVAIAAYCLGLIPNAIWFGKTPRSVAMDIIDGVAYALITAGFFGWLWPEI